MEDCNRDVLSELAMLQQRQAKARGLEGQDGGASVPVGRLVAALLTEIETLNTMLVKVEDRFDVRGHQGKDDISLTKQLQIELKNAKQFIEKLNIEKDKHLRRKMSVEMKLGEFEEYKSHLKTDLQNLYETTDELKGEIEKLKGHLKESEDARNELNKDRANLRHQLYKMKQESDGVNKINQELRQEIRDLKDSADAKSAHALMLEMDNSKMDDVNSDLECRIKSLQEKGINSQHEATVETKNEDAIQQLQWENEMLKLRIKDIEIKNGDLDNKLKNALSKISSDNSIDKILSLEAELAHLKLKMLKMEPIKRRQIDQSPDVTNRTCIGAERQFSTTSTDSAISVDTTLNEADGIYLI